MHADRRRPRYGHDCELLVSNLDSSATEEDLRALFHAYGGVVSVRETVLARLPVFLLHSDEAIELLFHDGKSCRVE